MPPIDFSYFDPENEKFHTLTTPASALTVLPLDQPGRIAGTGFSREEVKLLNRDIRYLKAQPGRLRSTDILYYQNWRFYAFIFLSLSLMGLSAGYRYWYDHWGKNTAYLRRRNAMKRATEFLRQAKQHRNEETYYSLLAKAILGFIGDKCDIEENALNTGQIIEHLKEHSVPQETVQAINHFLSTCDAGRFSPGARGLNQADGMDATARSLIKELNRHL